MRKPKFFAALILALGLLGLCPQVFAVPSIGIHTQAQNFASSLTTPTGSTSTTGSSLLVWTVSNQAFASGSISDTFTNTWTHSVADVTFNGGFRFINIWVCQNCTGGANHTVTVTFGSSQQCAVQFIEIKGVLAASLDQLSSLGSGSQGSSAVPGQSVTTTGASEAVLELWALNGNATYSAPTNSFTLGDQQNSSTSLSMAWADLITSSTGTYSSNATSTTTSAAYGSYAISFTASAPSCTHSGMNSAGAIATPNGSSGSYRGPTGAFVTPNCSSVNYIQSQGAIGST